MSMPDYYRILGVAPYSEDVVIQAAYRALMRRYHPDTNKSSDAGKRATEINEAYAVLNDPTRKARYDAQRKAARSKSQGTAGSTSKSEQTRPPPPPPPPPRADEFSRTQPPLPIDGRGAWIASGLVVGFIFLSAVLANSEGSSSQGDSDYVVENLTAENLVLENDLIAEEATPTPPPTLASVPQTPIQFDDVESAAVRFSQVLTTSGMAGARALSEKCHSGVAAEPKWSSADWCAAFDYAAAFVDAEVSRAGGWKPMPYFQFQAENQADRYREAGAADLFLASRLLSVKRAAEAAAEDAVRRKIAESSASDRQKTPNSTPAGGISGGRAGGVSTSSTAPSFDCAKARTVSEKTVCSDPILAELDRNMAIQYFQALQDATSEQRSLLERTGRQFIGNRDRCPGAPCISQTYFNRMQEIEEIRNGRWRG